MCGITGFINKKKGPADKRIIMQMVDTLHHRGPDDKGFFVNRNVALGMSRLSIIDITGGQQPVESEDGKIIVIFNGEIYNFRDLRRSLQQLGHVFRTQSDTEVIVHLYEVEGDKVFTRLNGMFAIAIYDVSEQKLILGRDRLGEKPLYYSDLGGAFIFGSELKAIIRHPKVNKDLDLNSLNRYLTFEYVPTPYSIFKNIYKLEASHYLIFQKNKVTIKKYWDVDFQKYFLTSEEEAIDKLEILIDNSVKMRLESDVPLGVFLSGGIDSSTIAYFAAMNSNRKLKTFSIGFKEESFDEGKYAKLVASVLNSDHHHHFFKSEDLLDLITKVSKLLDEPFADASILPTYLLSRFTRGQVKVALGGDGGDELFMGYPTFQAHKIAQIYENLPKFVHSSIVSGIVNRLTVSHSNLSVDFKIKRFISGVYKTPIERNLIWLGAFTSNELRKKLFTQEVYSKLFTSDPIKDMVSRTKTQNLDFWESLIYHYIKTYLVDDILVKVDRASMFNSLEVRSPFLDHRLVQFVNSLPPNLKMKGLTTKYILKKLMANKLPNEIVNRNKHGFGIPIAIWFRTKLKDLLLDTLSEKKIKREGIFNEKYVTNLIQEHLNGKQDNRKLLWTLIMFQLWKKNWLN